MSEQEPTQEEIIDAIYGMAAEAMAGGATDQRVQGMLVEQGLDQESASKVVSDLNQMKGEAIRDAGKKNMIYGALWAVGGTVVTVATYSAASGGGSYVVAWGAILFGAIQFIRGAVQTSTGK